jgi:pimeloyl-ACP methyl ester carboxylesterase
LKEKIMTTNSIYKSPEGKQEIMALYDAALARWPVPYDELRIPTRHGETFVIASGEPSAPPLVLLHGSASNAVSWVGDVAQYCEHFRVYAVDLVGEPNRSAPNRPSWNGPGFAEWLEDVLDGLKIKQTHLLGLSQGGWTALKYAVYQPERVSKLVLLTPGGVRPVKMSFLVQAIFLGLFGRWGAERTNKIVFGRQEIHPEAVKFMNAIMTHFKPRIEKEYLFTDEELKCLEMPALLLGGVEDAMIPVEAVAARLREFSPRLEVKLFPEMGHALVNMSEHIIPFLRV